MCAFSSTFHLPFLPLPRLRWPSHTHTLTHIAGVLNTGSDALSRPNQFPTWRSAIDECEELLSLRAHRVPCDLLFILALLTSGIPINDSYERITNILIQHAPRFLSTDDTNASYMTSLFSKHRHKTSRR